MPGQPNPYLALVAPKAPAPENPYLSLVGAPTSGTSGDVDLGARAAPEPTLPPVVVRAAPAALDSPAHVPAPARAASDATATLRPAADVHAPVTPGAIQAALPHPSIGGVGPGDVERQRVSRGLVKGDEMEQGRVNLGEALMGAASAFAPHPMGGETSEALAARLSAESERADALRAPTPTTGPGGTIEAPGAVPETLARRAGKAAAKTITRANAAAPSAPEVPAPAPPPPDAPTPDAEALATAGGGERFSGLPLLAKTRAAVRTAYRSALVTPNADAEGEAPAVVAAIHKANAAVQRAQHIGERRTAWVTEGLTPEQQQHFGRKLTLDNLDTEAQRRAQDAADRRAQHQSATKDDLQAGLEGHLAQMETRAARATSGREKYAILAEAQDLRDALGQATTKPALQALADQTFAQPLQEAADRFTAHADALRPQVPVDVDQQPWFQSALAKHRTNVEAPLTADALASGVDPASLRTPSSAYLRLMSTARLDDADIRRAMDATGAAAPGDLKPRGPVLRALIGERPELTRLFPAGASGARQGPLKPGAGMPPEGLPPTRGRVGVSGSARQAMGTADEYTGDYPRVVAADARDKAVKAARNQVYQEVAKIGRPLDAGELPTPGKQALAFDDTKGLVTGDAGVARFEVSPAVAKAVRRFHAGLEAVPATPAGAAWRRFTGGLTQVQLSGMPVEATSHANTLASIIASVPGEKDVTGKALVAVPLVGAKIAAIREMKGIDFADPATRALESRLADAGALRIESTPHGGILNSAHRWLFGPEGVDVRGRLVLARKYLARDPNATDEQLREFITGKLGNYVRGNSGALVTGLQDSGISAFARFQAARIPSSIRATFGASGLAATGAAQKTGDVANTLWRGTAGTLLGAQALNQMLVHHRSGQNERGHALDVQLGWGGKGAYIVDGKIVRLGDAEAQAMGDNARPLFIPGATLNPVVATGLRATGARDLLFSDRAGPGKLADAARDMTNTALGTVSPAARFLFTAATGRAPYLNSDGTMLKQSPARFNKDQEMADRAKAALASANPATHAFLGEGGEAGGRSLGGALAQDGQLLGGPASAGAKALEFLAPRVLAPGVGGVQNDVSAMARDEREYGDALTDYKAQIRRATGPMQVARIIAEAKADARRAGVSALAVELALTKFAATPEVASAAKREGALRRATARHREVP